jgi:hypothetical protein
MTTPLSTLPKLIHVASIQVQNQGRAYLLLRQLTSHRYVWFQEDKPQVETETSVGGGPPEEALLAAHHAWGLEEFRPLHCGFRYTLPERDEVGSNALFHHMVASYASMNGIYFDEELSANCIVQNASLEARSLGKRLNLL